MERRRAARIVAIAALAIGGWLWLRDGSAPTEPSPEPQATPAEQAEPSPAPPLGVPPVIATMPAVREDAGLPRDCGALAALASEGGPDAVLLAWLCPEHPLDAVAARAALLAVRSPDEAAALAPRLAGHDALVGLARLVAQSPAPAAAELPDPVAAAVSPIDDAVLGLVQRAHAVASTRSIPPTTRTRARALLAKTYLQATQQLGVAVGRPPEPFARLLAGRALHHGRLLCVAYLQGRVAGLAPLFHEVEASLWALVVALESSPHHGDAARLEVELEESRQYLERAGPRERLAARGHAPGEPLPLPDDAVRLLDLGLVDLAIARSISAATLPDGPGLRPVEQHLRDALTRAERDEYLALLEHRLARARARTPPPPEHGTAEPWRLRQAPWPEPVAVAEEAAGWIVRAPATGGLPQAYALGRAVLLVRTRPDALVLLVDLATAEDASPALRDAVGWLRRELEARDDGRLSWLGRRVATDPRPDRGSRSDGPALHQAEAARRRALALALRAAARQPRGAGIGDVPG